MALWLELWGFVHVLSFSLFYCCFSGSCLSLCSPSWGRGSWLLYFSLVCGLYAVYLGCLLFIMKTCLYNGVPLKPQFDTIKLGLTGVYIIFLISAHIHRLWVLVRTTSARRF